MQLVIRVVIFLLLGALGACSSQPAERKMVARPPAPRPGAAVVAGAASAPVPAPVAAPAAAVGNEYRLADSLRAFVGARAMKFRCVPEEDLRAEILAKPYLADTVFGRYIVLRELFEPARILYRAEAAATCWLEVKPEDVGESGTVGGDFTVDTARLAPGRRGLLLTLRGHQGFWGGSLDYGLTNLIDVTAEPRLLLKTELLREDASYGRENDSVYDEEAAGSEKREQQVSIRKGLITVGPATQTSTGGAAGVVEEITKPTPESMLPAGRYRYQHGKLERLGR